MNAGRPPRSAVHAAASRPTAKTGFSKAAANGPMNGTMLNPSNMKK